MINLKIYTINGYVYANNGWKSEYNDIRISGGKWVEGILSLPKKGRFISVNELPVDMQERLNKKLEAFTDEFSGRTIRYTFDGVAIELSFDEDIEDVKCMAFAAG